MAVIMAKVGCRGLFAAVGGGVCSLVLLIMMAEVLGGHVMLVRIIIRHRGPRELERDQTKQKAHEEAAHGRHYILSGTVTQGRQSNAHRMNIAGHTIALGADLNLELDVLPFWLCA